MNQVTAPSFRCLKSVYVYLPREVFELLRRVEAAVPYPFYRLDTPVGALREELVGAGALPSDFELPAGVGGALALDELSARVIDRVARVYERPIAGAGTPLLSGLAGYPYRYFTFGSAEGLFHLLAQAAARAGVREICTLAGEYEGFGAQAANLGLEVRQVAPEELAALREPRYWFLSNPSARDGNVLPEGLLPELLDRGHRVVLDLAYVGTTWPRSYDLRHENLLAILLSFSKPYGVFRYRMGFTFARREVPSLYGSKWFSDPVRALQAVALAEQVGPGGLVAALKERQAEAVKRIAEEWGLELEASDAFLVASLAAGGGAELAPAVRALIEPFRRGERYRFCLTPYFHDHDRDR